MINAILDPQFQPMALVVKAYKEAVAKAGGAPLAIVDSRRL